MHIARRLTILIAVALAAGSCTAESPAEPSSTTSTSLVAASSSTTVAAEPVQQVFIPVVAPARVDPVAGRWVKSNLGLDGLLVMPRDAIWDGTHFYLMQRVAFGDMRVWRSTDGLVWEELPSVGTFAMAEGGPDVLLSDGGRLIAGGRRGQQATLWIYEGSSPWAEVALGGDAWIRSVARAGPNLVAFGTRTVVDGFTREHHARLWASRDDGLSWTEIDEDRFGEFSEAVGVVSIGETTVAVTNRKVTAEDGRMVRDVPLLLVSRDGFTWEPLDIGLGETDLFKVTGGDRITLQTRSSVLQSYDLESWTKTLIDRSGIEHDGPLELSWFDDHIVLTGGVLRADNRFGEALYPVAWTYAGDGLWYEFGSLDELNEPGVIRAGVSGGNRFVAHGAEATAGSPDDGWAVYTFVPTP